MPHIELYFTTYNGNSLGWRQIQLCIQVAAGLDSLGPYVPDEVDGQPGRVGDMAWTGIGNQGRSAFGQHAIEGLEPQAAGDHGGVQGERAIRLLEQRSVTGRAAEDDLH